MAEWFIAEWREAWRFSSLWVATAGFGVLAVWNQMPGVVRARVPDGIEIAVGLSLWVAVLLARIIRQPGSQAKIDAKRAAAAPDDYSQWSDRARG
jgi:hypothetical protein